jgi:hypothetical protein
MSELQVHSVAAVTDKSTDWITVTEWSPSRTVTDTAIICSAITLMGAFFWLVGANFIFAAAAVLLLSLLASRSRTSRLICLAAYPEYFLVLQTSQRRLGQSAKWDYAHTSAEIIAVLERNAAIRAEERWDQSGRVHEIFVTHDDRILVLVASYTTQDDSLENLLYIQRFFQRNSINTSDRKAAVPSGLTARPRKGTLT